MYNFYTPTNEINPPVKGFDRDLLEYLLSLQKVEIQPLIADSPVAIRQNITWQEGPSWMLDADWQSTAKQQPAVELLQKCSALQTPLALGCLLTRETATNQSLLIRSFTYQWKQQEKTQSWEWLQLLARLHGGKVWGVLALQGW